MNVKSDELNVDGVIIIPLGELSAENLIQKILNVENLPIPILYKGISGYEWKVDTKYYSATVNLYCIPEKSEFDVDFCNKIQATIFYFSGGKPLNFESILNWMPSLKNISSEVQLLVCDSCDIEIRKDVLNWCVENQYELIELNPDEESDDEDDGIFSKSKGFGRVIEALQSHTWSNLIMKCKGNIKEKKLANEENENVEENQGASSKQKTHTPNNTPKKVKVDDEELLLEEQWLQKVLEQDDPEGESFEALFTKFASMKEKASGLTGEERKKYAEKVAVAFWKAMGGEDDEIEGLDDD